MTFVGAGDIAGSETSNQILNIPGDVFSLGDNAYQDGSASDFANSYAPTWGQFKSRTHPATGNHDYHQANASGYRGYFGYSATAPLYYSFDLGAWHVIALDSGSCDTTPAMCAAGSAQEAWLKADLASHTNACVLAYWHHPRFTSGSTHAPDLNVQAFWDDLYAANADLILNGHNHQYERFAPQNASGTADASQGIREFVVGTGGSGLYGFGTVQPNSQVRYNATHGVLKLTLRAGAYDWSFLPSTGSFTDTGSDTCHGGAGPGPTPTPAPTPTPTPTPKPTPTPTPAPTPTPTPKPTPTPTPTLTPTPTPAPTPTPTPRLTATPVSTPSPVSTPTPTPTATPTATASTVPSAAAAGFDIQPVWATSGTWSQATYDRIKAGGFTMVRFVLFWNRMEPSAGAWNETAFSTLSTAIARAKASGLRVMLDAIHLSGPGGMNYVPGWAKTGDSVTTIQTNGSGYVAELARRYGSDPTVVAYDPVNEPHRYPVDPTGVLSMYQTLISAIRAVDPDTLIAIEPTYGTASQSGACAPNWSILTNRKNLVLSVHDYYHGGDDNGFDADCTSSVSAAAYNGNKAALATHLSDWRAASTASGLPVWIGEFGINSGAAGHDQWITDVVSLYCSNGWNHSWWEYYSSSPALSATNPDKTWKSWVGLTRC